MRTQCMLTTVDNPYNPFDDYASWDLFDVGKGYCSSSRLMRIANVTDDMSEEETDAEIERAIDEIIKHDFTNTFKKVVKELNDVD